MAFNQKEGITMREFCVATALQCLGHRGLAVGERCDVRSPSSYSIALSAFANALP